MARSSKKRESIIAYLKNKDGPGASIQEIADEVGVMRQTSIRWLRQLEEEGAVSKTIIGPCKVYYITQNATK